MNCQRPYKNESWLRTQYLDNEISQQKLAALCGCSSATINKYIHRFSIPVKRIKPDRPLYQHKQWLIARYVEDAMTMTQIGELCGVSAMTISYWARRFSIKKNSYAKSAP